MKIFKNKTALIKEISTKGNLSFIPTMGGFHKGHQYLIKKAKKNNLKIIVSIFVNPKQFNSKKDFINYPREKKEDLDILKKLEVDYVYTPTYKDIYTFKSLNKIFLHRFSKKMCGAYRKNHFEGVLNVVNRFLEIIKPKYIYLGKKDFQQLFLISKHISKRKINTKVISCKIIRENNGIACSSRNKNLNITQQKIASMIYFKLKKIKNKLKQKKSLKINYKKIYNDLKTIGVNKIDYITLLKKDKITKPRSSKNKFNIFIAYHLGKIRLIDNL